MLVSCNGADYNAHDFLSRNADTNMFGRELYFEFVQLIVVDFVRYKSRFGDRAIGDFKLEASNDKINWVTLIYKNGEIINGDIPTERKGCFRYFKAKFDWLTDNYPRCYELWGTLLDNNESELVLLTPKMSANEMSWGKIHWHDYYNGDGAQGLTNGNNGNSVHLSTPSNTSLGADKFIKYEFAEPVVANFVSLGAINGNEERTARWYKLEGSDDDATWDLLLERQLQRDFYARETRWHFFDNETAYKYYKLTCLLTNGDQYWRISDFRLWRRQGGKWNFMNNVPRIANNGQDGYEVSASSEWSNGYTAMLAFDGQPGTAWVSARDAQSGAWLQVKFPQETICDCVKITEREGQSNQAPANFSIQGSEDGSTWNTLTTQSGVSWSGNETKIFSFDNETPYLYYRLVSSSNGGGADTSIGEFDIGRYVHEFKRWLHQYEYLVPAMTSNNPGNGYIASATSQYNNSENPEGAWRAFDRAGNQWTTVSGTRTNVELKIQLPAAAKCSLFRLTGSNAASRSPSKFRIEGSNNNVSWTVLYEQATAAGFAGGESRVYQSAYPDTPFLYYRLFVVENAGDGFLSVQEFSLIKEGLILEY
jgi:hypothetical protein